MTTAVHIFPNTIARNPIGRKHHAVLGWMVHLTCASCSKDGGMVAEETLGPNFACYVCDGCAEKYGSEHLGAYVEPDVVFWQRVKQEQLDQYGRELTQQELESAVQDEANPLSLLVKDHLKGE